MAVLGKREIGLIEDALKDIYETITGDAVAFRKSILTNLIQGDNGANYVTHTNALFDAFRLIEPEFSKLPLEKAIDFVKTSYDVLDETQQLNTMNIPEMMWTGFSETVDALVDIAITLNDNYDFEISTTNVSQMLSNMSEQLEGSNIKVGDIPEALEIQIRILDEMQYHEIAQMYTAWTSTEQMRPMTIQLVELYDQVDNLPDNVVSNLYTDFEDNLWITNEPNQYLLDYDNPEKLDTKSVKNMIKYFFEQVGRLQEGYINFNGAEHAFLDGFEISNELDTPLVLDDNLKLVTRDNLGILLPNSKEPYQLLHSITDFQGVGDGVPYQVAKEYFTRYQEIIGKTISDNFSDANFARTEYGINQKMSLDEFSFQWNIADISDLDTSAYDAIPSNAVDDIKLTGTMGGNTTPTGTNIAYADVEDLEQLIQFDRKAEGNIEQINDIKKTILNKGYMYDTAYEGGVVFGVIVDELGNVQIPEGNHRLQALIDVAKETNQKIYVPINPFLTATGGGNKVQLTDTDTAYNSMKQLLIDMLENNKNFNVERTIKEKLGEPGRRIIGLDSYTYPGGAPGTYTNQNNIKKFFNSIGLNTITYDELPDNNIYKTGINTFVDIPTNVVDDVTPTQALDELDEAISKSDGIDNLNKAKDIINKNPGVFRKIFSVLEKADIGDQVITKAIIPKVLPKIGLAAATGPVGIAYAAYEMALLLSDVGQAAYKAQTTDESFWDNFGEVSDKYSIAYKISKPVYDIILDSLNQDLTEEEDEEILFSFNR